MRVAVFVDARYVYAQGSTAITGLKTPKPRDQIILHEASIVSLLKLRASECTKGKELLRIYWYDGAPSSVPSVGQVSKDKLDDVKLRLGQLYSKGQQKGVDSLIVTDLMELARNKAISDAVVVKGDEDIRVGVQIAQSLGVRVHLLGISGPKSSQSLPLLQEADIMSALGKSKVVSFLSIAGLKNPTPTKAVVAKKSTTIRAKALKSNTVDVAAILSAVAATLSHVRQYTVRFERVKKTVAAGKDLPGCVVSNLKSGLLKSKGRNPSKPENKMAREATIEHIIRSTGCLLMQTSPRFW
jgi:uncharacterized LabA/DUF88 family protein